MPSSPPSLSIESSLPPTEALRELARREQERRKAKKDLLYLISHMRGVDQRTGEKFDLQHLRHPLPEGHLSFEDATVRSNVADWGWQRWLAEQLLEVRRLIILKGRQLGVTWICMAVDVAEAITMPDTASLLYRQKEDEAVDNVRRWFRLYQSLPYHFTSHIQVIKPDLNKTAQPGREGVQLLFPGGEISEIVPMTSAGSSGHGRSVRRINLDEGAFIELLEDIMQAVEPAAGGAFINMVSTANGRHNPDTGEGNEYSRRWTDARTGTMAYKPVFFPYDIHPAREHPNWRLTAQESQSLKPHQRYASFPYTEHEAFTLTSRTFFEADDLAYYRERIQEPLRRYDFLRKEADVAKLYEHDKGSIKVFAEPEADRKYAIGADVATGRGADYSAAHVIDLAEMSIAAEFHAKIDADLYAFVLHYLGRRYNTALIAVEIGGGYGEAVIIPLRDGREGRPAYPKLYIHEEGASTKKKPARRIGFPTNTKTRPLILNQLEKAVRERTLPYVTDSLLWEMESFVYHDTGVSPRALEGSRDDLVMDLAIGLEMYRLRGEHVNRRKRKKSEPYKSPYPWEQRSDARR